MRLLTTILLALALGVGAATITIQNVLVRTNAPSQDQITNSFIWANTVNGGVSNNIARLLSANPDLNPVTSGSTNNPVELTVLE